MKSNIYTAAVVFFVGTTVQLLTVASKAEDPAIAFDFASGNLPEDDIFQTGRMLLARKSEKIGFGEELVDQRKMSFALFQGDGKDGVRIECHPDDVMFGELSALTISLFVKNDLSSKYANFLHRLKQRYRTPGSFAFQAACNRTDDMTAQQTLSFRVASEEGGALVSAPEAIAVQKDAWTQIAMVYDGNEVKFYRDGEIIGHPVPISVSKIPAAGKSELATCAFSGAIAELVVLPNKALGDDQIRALFKEGPRSAATQNFLK